MIKSPFVSTTLPSKSALFSWFLNTRDCEVMIISGGAGDCSGGGAAKANVLPTRRKALVNPHADIAADPHFLGGKESVQALPGNFQAGAFDGDRCISPNSMLLIIPGEARRINCIPAIKNQ